MLTVLGVPSVSYIEPQSISQGGGVIFIHGSEFSEDNFNLFGPVAGNKIYFYNEYETIVCSHPIEKNWLLQNPQVSFQLLKYFIFFSFKIFYILIVGHQRQTEYG